MAAKRTRDGSHYGSDTPPAKMAAFMPTPASSARDKERTERAKQRFQAQQVELEALRAQLAEQEEQRQLEREQQQRELAELQQQLVRQQQERDHDTEQEARELQRRHDEDKAERRRAKEERELARRAAKAARLQAQEAEAARLAKERHEAEQRHIVHERTKLCADLMRIASTSGLPTCDKPDNWANFNDVLERNLDGYLAAVDLFIDNHKTRIQLLGSEAEQDQAKIAILNVGLRGIVKQWCDEIQTRLKDTNVNRTYEAVRNELRTACTTTLTAANQRTILWQAKLKPNQSPMELAQSIELANTRLKQTHATTEDLIQIFTNALPPQCAEYLHAWSSSKEDNTPGYTLTAAAKHIQHMANHNPSLLVPKPPPPPPGQSMARPASSASPRSPRTPRPGRTAPIASASPLATARSCEFCLGYHKTEQHKCGVCFAVGAHGAAKCPANPNNPSSMSAKSNGSSNPAAKGDFCLRCGGPGHATADCPKQQQQQQQLFGKPVGN